MSISNSFIDHGFRPDIRNRIGSNHEELIDLWQMSPNGTPLPSERIVKVAMWFGRRWNKNGELPVVVAATPPNEQIINTVTEWYYGLAEESDVLSHPVQAYALADAACFRVDSPTLAFDSLKSMLPTLHYDLTVPLYDLPNYPK